VDLDNFRNFLTLYCYRRVSVKLAMAVNTLYRPFDVNAMTAKGLLNNCWNSPPFIEF